VPTNIKWFHSIIFKHIVIFLFTKTSMLTCISWPNRGWQVWCSVWSPHASGPTSSQCDVPQSGGAAWGATGGHALLHGPDELCATGVRQRATRHELYAGAGGCWHEVAQISSPYFQRHVTHFLAILSIWYHWNRLFKLFQMMYLVCGNSITT